jgi:hypothetical protein
MKLLTLFDGKIPRPKHVHAWKAPTLDTLSSDFAIEFALCGEICDCGATRLYQGPAKGFLYLKEGTV